MMCEHCGKEDHMESACAAKAGERAWDVVMGIAAILVLFPFLILGMAGGLAWGAALHGFSMSIGIWKKAVSALLGKKDHHDPAI